MKQTLKQAIYLANSGKSKALARAAALLSGYAAEMTPEEEAVERRHRDEILRGAGLLMSGGKG